MARLSRRDVIITCIVGFIAWLWTVHFLPSLRFVPHAFATGLLLAIGAVAYAIITTADDPRPAINAPLPPQSYLRLTSQRSWPEETRKLQQRSRYTPITIYDASRRISKRINTLLDLILRDFVKSWYSKISSSPGFSNQIDRSIRLSLQNILDRFFRLDIIEFGVIRWLPIINGHIKAYSEAERMVRGKRQYVDTSDSKELEAAIAERFRDGRLHAAANVAVPETPVQQQQHLRRVIGRILSLVLPANMQSSTSVITLVKEIVACAVLVPVMSLIADPDMLNQLIEAYGRSILHERKTVRKLRAALDEHASPGKASTVSGSLPRLRQNDSERAFEAFVKAIRACASMSDAERSFNEVSRQIQRENKSQRRDVTYIRRLEIGRKLLGQRKEEIAAQAAGMDLAKISLRELLYDASGLAYLMEYMDGIQLLSLVQFWVVADAFRNNSTGVSPTQVRSRAAWVQADRDLLVQISGRYLWKPEMQVPQQTQEIVNAFLNHGDAATHQQYIRARVAIIELQDAIYARMNDDYFASFKSSDLFRQWSGAPITSPFKPSSNEHSIPPSLVAPMPAPVTNLNPASNQLRPLELRRAVASHSDLSRAARASSKIVEPRRSLDEDRRPLFGDDAGDDPLSRSTASLDSLYSPVDQHGEVQQGKMISAVQAALDEAMDEESDNDLMGWGQDSLELSTESPRRSFEATRSSEALSEPIAITANGKPNLSSLGLLGTPSRRTVFSEGDLFGEGEKTLLDEDEGNETDTSTKTADEDIHEAAPGDLGLSELVQSLTLAIEKLEAQQKVVDSLIQKAELTNNAAELRILRKSRSSLDREIHRKELQRQQYIVQRTENDLYGRANVSIKSIMVGTEPDGHEFALYVIEVTRRSTDSTPAVTWAITRRYSEFHDLHRRIRKHYPSVRDVDFPRRQVVLTLQKDFLKKRSSSLENYLRELLDRPQVCRSLEFRAFLSQQTIRPVAGNGQQIDKQDFITRIYNSVTDGMEEFIGNVPVLDQLSAAGQSLITAATAYNTNSVSATASPIVPQSPVSAIDPVGRDSPRQSTEAQAEISAFESRADPETVTFIKPICDTLLEVFGLNSGNNWLRGRAVVVVTQQLLGGTIERRVRETYKSYTSESNICTYLDKAKELLWPDGKSGTSPPERTDAEKESSRRNASVVLQTLLPELAGGVVGRGNAVAAARKIHATLENEGLNRHLVYCLLDEVVEGIFGVRVDR